MIRSDAERAVADIVVSHRVRKKVSGPLHKETTYGDTREDITTSYGTYRRFVTRKPVGSLTKSELPDIRDRRIREIVVETVAARGGDPKKAFPPYPRVSPDGPSIRKVRILSKHQLNLMAPISTGFADLGSNHHIAIYRETSGGVIFEVVSLFEAARRLAKRETIIRRSLGGGEKFVMSLSPGDLIALPKNQKTDVWVVTGFWSNGQIVLEHSTDASHATTTRPKAASLLAAGAQKLSVDPIGRIRMAND
jgi:CRISPR-associated endonuclease Csn1